MLPTDQLGKQTMKLKTLLLSTLFCLNAYAANAANAADNLEYKIEDIMKNYNIDSLEPNQNIETENVSAKSSAPPKYLLVDKQNPPLVLKDPPLPKQEFKMKNVKDGKFVTYGTASYYGKGFHGRRTANGEIYNMYGLTAASNSLRFGTQVKVTCMTTGKSVVVKVNDTGSFTRKYGRVIDLSYGAAQRIDMLDRGLTKVKLEILK